MKLFALKMDFGNRKDKTFGVYSLTEDTTKEDLVKYLKKERFLHEGTNIGEIQLHEDGPDIQAYLFGEPFARFEALDNATILLTA